MFAYQWDFSFMPDYYPALWSGVLVTAKLSIITIIASTVLGTILGIISAQSSARLRQICAMSIDIIRSVPVLILILWVYYLFPVLGLNKVDPFWPASVALVINNTAFLADIIRGSIEGIPKGGALAARSLGMDRLTILKRIILPEVYRESFSSIVLMYLAIIRVTPLASVVSVYEVTHVGDYIISRTYKPLEVYSTVALIYLLLIFPITLLARRLEKSRLIIRRAV